MKGSIIFLIGMFCAIALFAQQHRVPAQKERIYLGENVLIKGDWNLDMAIARNLEYTDLPGYSGNYDALSWKIDPFLYLKYGDIPQQEQKMSRKDKKYKRKYEGGIISPPKRNCRNHIENQDKNILILLDICQINDKDYIEVLRRDFENLQAGESGDGIRNLRAYIHYMPTEYSQMHFNADTTLTYHFDMGGKMISNRYGHHKGILIYDKNADMVVRMDCLLTDEGLKDFDSKYLKDIEKMFRFKDLEAQK